MNWNDIEIRPVFKADKDEAIRLAALATSKIHLAGYKERIAEACETNQGVVAVSESDSAAPMLIGLAILQCPDLPQPASSRSLREAIRVPIIDALEVHPACSSRGIGTHLMNTAALLAYANSDGPFPGISTYALGDNPLCIQLLQSHGFLTCAQNGYELSCDPSLEAIDRWIWEMKHKSGQADIPHTLGAFDQSTLISAARWLFTACDHVVVDHRKKVRWNAMFSNNIRGRIGRLGAGEATALARLGIAQTVFNRQA